MVRLSNKINEINDIAIFKHTDRNKEWKEYVDTILKQANQRDKVNFGGRDPRAPRAEEEVRFELPVRLLKSCH